MQLLTDSAGMWAALIRSIQSRPVDVAIVTAPATPWLRTVVDVLASLATVAVSCFAFLEWRRANREKGERLREAAARVAATDARIGSIAFALRRQIESWLQHPSVVNLNSARPWLDYLVVPTNVTEARLTELMELAPAASPPVCNAVQLGFLWFYRAFDLVNAIRELAHADQHKAAADRIPDAQMRLELCREWITAAVPEDVLDTDAKLAAELAVGGRPPAHLRPLARR
jgi:hypothetical protein